MKKLIVVSTLACGMLFAIYAVGQNPTNQSVIKDDVPQAALLTERGTALAKRLKWLRHSEANMGAKHPSLPQVREEIESVKKELKAWAPAPNPFDNPNDTGARSVPKMNDEDLRQLVVRLSEEVAALKKRVAELERNK